MTASSTTMTTRLAPGPACKPAADIDGDRGRDALQARALALLRRGWRAYWQRRARRATVLILCALDERTLRDIGINPSEIESCVYSPSGDRLRRYNEAWPWRSR